MGWSHGGEELEEKPDSFKQQREGRILLSNDAQQDEP